MKVIEMGGLGPGPFCGMVLSDLGAEVLQVSRPSDRSARHPFAEGIPQERWDLLNRGRRSIAIDAKDPRGRDLVQRLASGADVFIEGFRPGVMERLHLGPDDLSITNERLIYARVTGWGQDGPLALSAGHDINYLALSGLLGAIGHRGGAPAVPLNVVADFGGGGMLAVMGILAALRTQEISGKGQVVDAAMVDGVALLSAMTLGLRSAGLWRDDRGTNFNDSGAPFYTVYETADGRYIAVGAIETQFYKAFMEGLDLDPVIPDQWDRSSWAEQTEVVAARIVQHRRDEWVRHFSGVDACVSPVLDLGEAIDHDHHRSRSTYLVEQGAVQPSPAPRFSRTPLGAPGGTRSIGADTGVVLSELGLSDREIEDLRSDSVVASNLS